MKLAREEMVSYKERATRTNLDLNVHVLSVAAWPSYPDVEVNIPPEVSSALRDFDRFYNNKYNGRKLFWKHSLAHCQLKARFPKGYKEIVVSSFQAIVLLLFNDVRNDETLSYRDLRKATGLRKYPLCFLVGCCFRRIFFGPHSYVSGLPYFLSKTKKKRTKKRKKLTLCLQLTVS